MKVNLQEFYVAHTNQESHIFLTKEEADNFCQKNNERIRREFDQWLSGDRTMCDGIAESKLEADVDGNAHQYFVPRGDLFAYFDTHEAYSCKYEHWQNVEAKGFERVQWGNPATVRPSKKSVQSVVSF